MEIAGSVGAILALKGSAVWSIAPNSMVFDAIQLMADKNVGALPVVDNGQLVGMISERDYTRKVALQGRSSKDTPVREIMTREVVTVNMADSVTECMRAMTDGRIRHLPVMEGNQMIGLVSIGDLVRGIISAHGDNRGPPEIYYRGISSLRIAFPQSRKQDFDPHKRRYA
jgi:CBS domain-containing protein